MPSVGIKKILKKFEKEVDKVAKKYGTKKTNRATKRDARYSCGVCGLVVTVDNICDCVEACDIICCGQEMKPKK